MTIGCLSFFHLTKEDFCYLWFLFPNNKKIDFWEIEYYNIFEGGDCDEIDRTFKLFTNTNLHEKIEMQKAKELLE